MKEGDEMDSKILFLSECVQSLVTKKKTQMKTVFTVTLHGLTRNKEIVQRAYNLGIGITYKKFGDFTIVGHYMNLRKVRSVPQS